MASTDYTQRGNEQVELLIAELFAIGGIGYVALGSGQEVLLRAAPELVTDTSAESNFYEELLVNPTLLALASQRAGLDCGGLRYIAIGYGKFVQLIMRMKHGHLSLGVARNAAVPSIATKASELLERYALGESAPQAWLLEPAKP